MNSEKNPDDILTHRMNPPSVPLLIEEKTQRMDSRLNISAATNQDSIPTRHAATTGTGRINPSIRSLGFLPAGTVIANDCVVIQTLHNHESARPGLFECQSPEGHVMVKVAASEHPPQRDLWEKLVYFQHPYIVRTYRTLEVEGIYYEIQEFCSGGTLAELVPLAGSGRPIPPSDWVEKSLVPAFYAGIKYLHEQGIVHRDIKPSNLYLRESNGRKTLVIGDFDISSVLQSGRTSRATERAAGTWIYSAPESLPRFMDVNASQRGASIARASDYYSFGVVIVELLVGTTSLHQAQFPEISDFYLQGGRVEIPSGLSPRLTELLGGLLCRNRQKRWGNEEVARWLANKTTEVDRRAIAEDRGFQLGRHIAPFNSFELSKPSNLEELLSAIIQEPKIAIEELMAGDVLLNWIGQLDSRIARQIRLDREKWRRYPRMALLCARLRLDPKSPLPVAGDLQANSAEEWATMALRGVAKRTISPEKLCNREALLEIENWLRLKASPELEAAGRVAKIAAQHGLAANSKDNLVVYPPAKNTSPNFQLVLEELCYVFLPDRPYFIAPNISAQTPQQIVKLTMGKKEDWGLKPAPVYFSSIKRWQDGYLEAYLRQRLSTPSGPPSPILGQINKVRTDFADKPFVAFEVILRLLDPELPPVQIEFDQASLQDVIELPYGDKKTVTLRFRAINTGMPFAALKLQSQWDALTLDTHQINVREGEVTLNLHSQRDIPVGRDYSATLSLESRTTKLANDDLSIRYRVIYPVSETLKRIGMGALIGAALFGGARLLLMLIVPRTLQFEYVTLLSRGTWFMMSLVLTATIFAAFSLWFWAMSKHSR
jgi:serine/threonine protein kinase